METGQFANPENGMENVVRMGQVPPQNNLTANLKAQETPAYGELHPYTPQDYLDFEEWVSGKMA
jgi:hypothetical protein